LCRFLRKFHLKQNLNLQHRFIIIPLQ